MLSISSVMMRSAMTVAVLLLMVSVTVKAQELKKGDPVPGTVASMVKYPGKQLVIIQFWNTICSACIHSLSKIDSLQLRYAKEVQFVLVTSQSEEVVNEFFEVRKKILKPRGAIFFYADTVLKKYFPYTFVPHHVWISEEGNVVAITSSMNTHENSIKDYLTTKASSIPGVTKRINQDWKVPVLTTHYQTNSKSSFHSYLLPAIDSFVSGTTLKKTGDSKGYNRIIIHKSAMPGLFMEAYSEGKERFNYAYNNYEVRCRSAQRNDTALYLYDLQVPADKAGQLYAYMREDMERMFDFSASIENRKVKCLILKASTDTVKAITKGGAPARIAPKHKGDSLRIFRNIPMQSFVYILNRYSRTRGYQIVDETGIYSNVDIAIQADIIDVLDIAQLKKDLFSYGILLEERTCEGEVLVLSER